MNRVIIINGPSCAGKTTIVLSTATNLPYDADSVLIRTEQADILGQGITANARDEFGNRLDFNNEEVADKIAPVLLTAKRINDTTIELTFSEDLKGNTFAPALPNGFSVSGSTIRTELDAADFDKVIVTRVSGNAFVVGTSKVSYTAGSVVDLVNNKLASFSPVDITN